MNESKDLVFFFNNNTTITLNISVEDIVAILYIES